MPGRILMHLAAAAVVASACSAGLADDQKAVQTARQLAARHADSIVIVSAVIKTRYESSGATFPMPSQERKTHASGTVIDASGLTVVPSATLDMFSSAVSSVMGEGENKIEIKTEISDVKIEIPGGKDVPARIVLKDEDLGLMYVQPDKGQAEAKGIKWKPLELTETPAVQVLDTLIGLYRMGKALGYAPAVSLCRVAAVVKKPRPFIVPEITALMGMGMPMFNADGKLLGIVSMLPMGGEEDAGPMGSEMTFPSPVIVPVDALKRGVTQVKEAEKANAKPAARANEKEKPAKAA